MKKVVHLTSVHSYTDTRIFIKECQSLVRAGYEVVLIAPHPLEEMKSGVRLVGVKKARWMPFRLIFTVPQVAIMALKERAQIYHLHDPELLPVGVLLKIFGKKVIYDAHEDYPQQVVHKSWVPIRCKKIVAILMRLTEICSVFVLDQVVAATPKIAQNFPSHKCVVVRNFPIIEEFTFNKSSDYGSRPNNFSYVGNLTKIRGCREMCSAIRILPANINAKLVLAGSFSPPDLIEEVFLGSGKKHIDCRGFVGRKEVAEILDQSKAGLVVLHPVKNYLESMPVKMFEYMAAGLPVIASDFPEWVKIIQKHECGLMVDPMESREIAKAMQWIIEHPKEAEAMGKRGQSAVRKYYQWKLEEGVLLKVYSVFQ